MVKEFFTRTPLTLLTLTTDETSKQYFSHNVQLLVDTFAFLTLQHDQEPFAL